MGYGKLYGRQVFRATVEGKEYVFTCYTQDCYTHVRELCCEGFSNTTESKYIKRDIVGKYIFYNRPWYRFKYEIALRNGIENIDATKEVKQELHDILIEGKAQKEHEEAEAFINSFKAIHESLSEDNKSRLASMVDSLPNGMITTEEQAQSIKGIATLMSLMQ